MTSKNSFWANRKENHKRRIWVWIVSVLGQMAVYVGRLLIYLTRQRIWFERGEYADYNDFHELMCRATADALGFNDSFMIPLIGLAVIIGVQGFSYLDDRRKVDLYHSVPVDKNKRFAAVYVNGLMIYLISTVLSILVGILAAAAQNAVNGTALAEIGLGFLWNLMFFLVIYHTVILAVMLTGNRLISLCMTGVLMLYEIVVNELSYSMEYEFFNTASTYFVYKTPRLSAVYDYFSTAFDLKGVAWNESVRALAQQVLPYCGKWLILAVVFLALSWLCYRKRPSEAAGRAITFAKTEPVLKVLVVIPACIGLGMIIYDTSYGSMLLTTASLVIGGVIACAAVEIIYDFDIKSMLKHPVSGAVSIVGIVLVFMIYKFDLLGYDNYVPQESSVDSVALHLSYLDGGFWNEEFSFIDTSTFAKEHMFVTDVEPVLTLVNKWYQERERLAAIESIDELDDTADYRTVHVMYRLKSGREVGREFCINFNNPANEELLNRIVETKEYKEGVFQILTDRDSFDQVQTLTYGNGAATVALQPADAQELRDAYVKDMEKFDFTFAKNKRPCGRIGIEFPNYRQVRLDVYEGFENTIAYLQSQGAYYPLRLNPEDIANITVTCYHREEDARRPTYYSPAGNISYWPTASVDYSYSASSGDTVSATFYEQEEFEQIVDEIYPRSLAAPWHSDREMDSDYDVYVTFRADTNYPYSRSEISVNYRFYAGQTPKFVEEATALDKETK